MVYGGSHAQKFLARKKLCMNRKILLQYPYKINPYLFFNIRAF